MNDACRYILRVEGVNLSYVIDDTDQLSVRRGGGLMILNATTEVFATHHEDVRNRLQAIATGASIGLFEFAAKSDEDAEDIRTEVERLFRMESLHYQTLEGQEAQLPLKHGTFVVDVARVGEAADVQQTVELATAKNRWRQLQSPTLSLDGIWDPGEKPCDLDRTRVGTEPFQRNGQDGEVSKTALDRWHYGRGARQNFYGQELSALTQSDPAIDQPVSSLDFTDDLRELSGRPDVDVNEPDAVVTEELPDYLPDHLIDKIAVFYVDGNHFGKKGRDLFKHGGVEAYRLWSTALRNHHRSLLRGLVQLADTDATWKNGADIRLETLLWGGDEILWVVPAWKGWEVAKWFFSQAHRIKAGTIDEELTYGCGLVFCHAKAPIKNVSALAKRLGDVAKQDRGTQNVHRLAYEVLESFDDVTGDLTMHRQRFLPPGTSPDELVIDPTALEGGWETLRAIGDNADFPMRQLYMLTNGWRKGRDIETSKSRMRRTCEEGDIDIDLFLSAFGGTVAWLHLLQILPYLPNPTTASSGATT